MGGKIEHEGKEGERENSRSTYIPTDDRTTCCVRIGDEDRPYV